MMRRKNLSRPLRKEGKPLKSDDPGKIDLATEKITAVSHKLAELMYKKQQEEASAGAGEGGAEGQAPGAGKLDLRRRRYRR